MSYTTNQEQPTRILCEDLEIAHNYGLKAEAFPKDVLASLRYPLYPWQQKALDNFMLAMQQRKTKVEERGHEVFTHYMLNLATGAGKTLLMAALMLYYYKQGRRYFIFFTSDRNIVGKTQANFINKSHAKYQFADQIVINGQQVRIREVEHFSAFSDDLQIKFTTIHKLHNDLNSENENALLLSELQKVDIVMLADEAHHLNATTRKQYGVDKELFRSELTGRSSEKDVERSWETTVNHELLRKGKTDSAQLEENHNVLLEFTATIPDIAAVHEKYNPITLYKFTLKEFVRAGYTKEVFLARSNYNKRTRTLQALCFNWLRQQVAIDYGIPNFKPVILFRSKTIDDSNQDFKDFRQWIDELKPSDLCFLNSNEHETEQGSEADNRGLNMRLRLMRYMKEHAISTERLVADLQTYFDERACLITNSKTNKRKTEQTDAATDSLLNSLEQTGNPIRAIFTVNRLTEGWDVLNLYDIVRLYKGRDANHSSGNVKAGTSTTQEVQLIGRGVRYFPFSVGDDSQKYCRKFDNDLTHPLRVLEEFFFHCEDDHRYISELTQELKNRGLKQDRRKPFRFKLKDSIQRDLKNYVVMVNHRIDNPNRKLKEFPIEGYMFTYEFNCQHMVETHVDLNKEQNIAPTTAVTEKHQEQLLLKEMPRELLFKALHRVQSEPCSQFRFNHLSQRIGVTSSEELIYGFMGNIHLQLTLPAEQTLTGTPRKEQLQMLINLFHQVERELKEYDHPYIGSDFELKPLSHFFAEAKEKMIDIETSGKTDNEELEAHLKQMPWYAIDSFWGTSEERAFIGFIENNMGNLREQYSQIILLRNEEQLAIFDFDTGQKFEPDFLLLLKKSCQEENKGTEHLQCFAEPKGDNLLDADAWKERLLKQITERYGHSADLRQYKVIGLPFFNQQNRATEFTNAFNTWVCGK